MCFLKHKKLFAIARTNIIVTFTLVLRLKCYVPTTFYVRCLERFCHSNGGLYSCTAIRGNRVLLLRCTRNKLPYVILISLAASLFLPGIYHWPFMIPFFWLGYMWQKVRNGSFYLAFHLAIQEQENRPASTRKARTIHS